ncbi:hypothetical protein M8037_02145, partial [Sinorhizobium meliloti]|nr:hypothetical protein [Sinorhizobium meliloti]
PAGHLLPAGGAKETRGATFATMTAREPSGMSLLPACGEKVAGRPDEGRARATRSCQPISTHSFVRAE